MNKPSQLFTTEIISFSINNNVVTHDTHKCYNNSIYTIPVTGYYNISSSAGTGAILYKKAGDTLLVSGSYTISRVGGITQEDLDNKKIKDVLGSFLEEMKNE